MCTFVNVENRVINQIKSEPLIDTEAGRFMVSCKKERSFLYLDRGAGNVKRSRLKWKINIEGNNLLFERCMTLNQLTYIIFLGVLSIFFVGIILLFLSLLLTGSLFEENAPVGVYIFFVGYCFFEFILVYVYKKLYKVDDKKTLQIFLDNML